MLYVGGTLQIEVEVLATHVTENGDGVMCCRYIDDWRERWGLCSEAESYER
jgi:hypothetical protein